jgi:hypothetical protein
MSDKSQDPNLQAPQEANTTEHINFLESEAEGGNSEREDSNASSENPTKKAWEELRRDQQEHTGSKD